MKNIKPFENKTDSELKEMTAEEHDAWLAKEGRKYHKQITKLCGKYDEQIRSKFTGLIKLDDCFSIGQMEDLHTEYAAARPPGTEIGCGFFDVYIEFDGGRFKGFRMEFEGT